MNKVTNDSIQLVRNATLIINYAGKKILVDPMFFPKGAFDPIAGSARNPLVELPIPLEEIIRDIDLVLVTHTHPDHFDPIASQSLNKSIKLLHQPADEGFFQKEGFTNTETVTHHTVWNTIRIYRTGGQHGSGEVLKHMGTVSGYVLQAENHPTVYIVGDSIWTDEVVKAINTYKPDSIIVNSGGAQMPGFEGSPILMDEEQTITLIKASGEAKIIAVHMEALDHCHTTRESLHQQADESHVGKGKLVIPQDGETILL
jgi:L-ascorbate metabolism protein UlaG (beta-lactamase superfamily)